MATTLEDDEYLSDSWSGEDSVFQEPPAGNLEIAGWLSIAIFSFGKIGAKVVVFSVKSSSTPFSWHDQHWDQYDSQYKDQTTTTDQKLLLLP